MAAMRKLILDSSLTVVTTQQWWGGGGGELQITGARGSGRGPGPNYVA